MTCGDIPGRVHISMAGVSAGGAPEDGLALARLRIHMPAGRTSLACEGGTDLLDPADGFLFQAARQQAPARPQDLAVQPGLGADVAARVLPRAPGRPGHVPDLEAFDLNDVEPACQASAGLLGPVLAPVGLAGARPCDGELKPAPAIRSPFGAGELALQPSQPVPLRRGQARYEEDRCAGPARAPVRVLLDGEVPHVPGVRAVAVQHRFLSGRGKQSVAGRANTLAKATDISGEVKRRLLPAKAEVWSPRS